MKVDVYTPHQAGYNINMRVVSTAPDCTLEDIKPFFTNPEKRLLWDKSKTTITKTKEYPLNTSQYHA